jgi:CubicO group peptidase (beta-lactamase class C family)
MKKIALEYVAFFIWVILFSCSDNQNNNTIAGFDNPLRTLYNYRKAEYQFDSLFKDLYTNSSFNGIFLVAKKGNIIYENFYGYADYEKKDTLNKNSLFQLASVSKQFVSTSIIYLKTKKLLNYNDKVSTYLTEFPYHEITIENLLNHTSGLPNYIKMLLDNEFYSNPSNEAVYNYFCKNIPALNFNPDERFEYSNTNYVFLTLIIEKITGKSFYDFLDIVFFENTNINSTFIFKKSEELRINTKGYFSEWNISAKNYFDYVYGDKAFFTTAEDLLKWDKILYSNTIINQNEIDSLFGNRKIEFKENSNFTKEYYFGWFLAEINGSGKIMYHTGHWGGYNSLFLRDINKKNTIIILCNVITDEIYLNIEKYLKILEPDFDTCNVNLY